MVLSLMLASGGIAHVVDVKGAFLYGEFSDREKIHIKIPFDLRNSMTKTKFYC